MNISETFKNNISKQELSIINSVPVNWTKHAIHIKNLAMGFEPKFKFTKKNKVFFQLLLLYFTGNPKFDSYLEEITGKVGSRDKGLLIVGPVGSGKTFSLEKVFKEFTATTLRKNSYQIYDYYSIISDYELNGAIELKKFGHLRHDHNGYHKDNTFTALIDDFLSSKPTAMHFGNKTDIADLLVNLRYEAYKRSRKLTHFTMNLYPKELENILDERSISRLREMCNIIELKDCDWRKQ